MKTIKERKQEGKEVRKETSRRELGRWEVRPNRKIVEELIVKQEASRVQSLIPLRRQRMAVSPFTFFRGAAVLQAHDLASAPKTPFTVQACGDAHISNFGLYASAERRMVFDINDFDETLPAPFETDIKRLLASVEICGRDRKFTADQRQQVVYEAAAMYRKTMREHSDSGNMEVWYEHIDIRNFMNDRKDEIDEQQAKLMNSTVQKAMTRTSSFAVGKLLENVNGELHIKSNPPLVVSARDMIPEEKKEFDFRYDLVKTMEIYKKSLSVQRRRLLDQYEPLELAHKVVGVGSVGRQTWILVLMGRENGDPLVLQIKEADHSVLEEYYGASSYSNCGQRVVEGQRSIQTAGDILLGWARLKTISGKEKDFYVRQLWDDKGSFDLKNISCEGYRGLSLMCAWTLATAHAKTGDRHAIAGYLGKNDSFETAMTGYARAYADQNEADYETFLKFSRAML